MRSEPDESSFFFFEGKETDAQGSPSQGQIQDCTCSTSFSTLGCSVLTRPVVSSRKDLQSDPAHADLIVNSILSRALEKALDEELYVSQCLLDHHISNSSWHNQIVSQVAGLENN